MILYTYVGYPLLLSIRRKKSFQRDDTFEPSVSLIITAYNEERVIVSKLQNSLELDYPRGKLEIILASDGSTDATVLMAKKIPDIKVMSLERKGKTFAQNSAAKVAKGDILIFSDANGYYSEDAVRKIVRNFKDSKIGCVCGELSYKGNSKEGLYWKYEIMIKKLEGRTGELLGANGCIYAVRKEYYVDLANEVISDFVEPLKIFESGKYVLYENEAYAWEDNPNEVLQRKRRIILRSLQSLKHLKILLNPLNKRNLFWQLLSHKILRWFMPFILISLFVSSFMLYNEGDLYKYILLLQIGGYMGATFNLTIRYYLLVNVASLLGIIDLIRGKTIITWSVER